MQDNGETQEHMPSLNDIISGGSQQQPNQVSYSHIKTVQTTAEPTGQSTYSVTRTVNQEEPATTTKITKKVVTTQQPTTETSYYAKKITTTKTTTTTTTGRGNQNPTTQTTVNKYSNTATTGGRGNQGNTYTRPNTQINKPSTITTTVQRGQNSNTNSQVYRGNQRNVAPPTKLVNSQSYAGNKYQPKRPETSSYKPKARSPEPGSLKRKTINRGNPVENVQITHIIYSSGPAEFHITENLNLENLNTAPIQISKSDRARLQKSGKVIASCSCDGVEIAQPKKVNLKGNTTHYQHAQGIGMTNDRKENINPMFYSSEIKKLNPVYKDKEKEKIENIENFRSAGKAYNNIPSSGKATTQTTTTYNKASNYSKNSNQSYRGATTNNTRGGMASSMSTRGGGMTSSNTNTRGGMASTMRGTNYRGGAGGDGEIIKETNTRVQMGSRSNINPSKPTVSTTHERKVYTQKNFFNK